MRLDPLHPELRRRPGSPRLPGCVGAARLPAPSQPPEKGRVLGHALGALHPDPVSQRQGAGGRPVLRGAVASFSKT